MISLCISLRIIKQLSLSFSQDQLLYSEFTSSTLYNEPQNSFHCKGRHIFFTCGQWNVVNLKSLKLLYLSSIVILFQSTSVFQYACWLLGQTGRLIQEHSAAMLFIIVIICKILKKINTCPLKLIAKDITLNVNNNVEIKIVINQKLWFTVSIVL